MYSKSNKKTFQSLPLPYKKIKRKQNERVLEEAEPEEFCSSNVWIAVVNGEGGVAFRSGKDRVKKLCAFIIVLTVLK